MNSYRFISALTLSLILPGEILAEGATETKDPAKHDAAEAEGAHAETAPLEPGTDIVCEADVFYNWKPEGIVQKKILPAAAPPPEDEIVTPTPPESIREFFTTAGEQGVVEDEVTNRLNTKIPAMQRQASDYCKDTHQDQTLCISAKLRASFEQYNKLDFVTRRAMAEAMNAECISRMGKCLGTEVSEISCHVNRSPEVPLQPPPEAKEAAKDKKK